MIEWTVEDKFRFEKRRHEVGLLAAKELTNRDAIERAINELQCDNALRVILLALLREVF